MFRRPVLEALYPLEDPNLSIARGLSPRRGGIMLDVDSHNPMHVPHCSLETKAHPPQDSLQGHVSLACHVLKTLNFVGHC